MRSVIFCITTALMYSRLFTAGPFAAAGRKITVLQPEPAQTAYDHGFAQGVMRGPYGSVRLRNHVLAGRGKRSAVR